VGASVQNMDSLKVRKNINNKTEISHGRSRYLDHLKFMTGRVLRPSVFGSMGVFSM